MWMEEWLIKLGVWWAWWSSIVAMLVYTVMRSMLARTLAKVLAMWMGILFS
jgi:hypothetical protein